MSQKLAGKVAVVTGAGGGVGGAIAFDMAAEGAKVVVNDFGKDESGKSYADLSVERIKKAGGTAVANYDSVITMKGGAGIINTAVKNYGRIDILVNTAGFSRDVATVDMTEDDWDSVITVHLKGHFACIQPAIKEMMKQKWGRIICVSSRSAFTFSRGGISYAAAKAGVLGIMTKLSVEMKDYGITVNSFIPCAITKGFKFGGTRPGGGPIEGPEYTPPIVVYLCTEEARNITNRIFYAGSGDIMIYQPPMQYPGPHTFVRKPGKWTLDELSEMVPGLVGVPRG